MKYAYPQDPTHAVSAIRRLDESSDSSTSQSNLERQQDIAVVGETVPMIFCHRFNWGGQLGTNGGVWISPRLIQLGIEQTDLSMMYLLSQGKVTGLKTDNTYWGYNKLKNVDSSAQMCYRYEAVPSCLDLDYDPGGSISWTTTVTQGGPSGTGSFNTPNNCIKIAMTFNASIRVTGSAVSCGGYAGKFTMQKPIRHTYGLAAGYHNRIFYKADSEWFPDKDTDSRPTEMEILWTRGGPVRQYEFWYGQRKATAREYDYGGCHKSVSINQTSEVRVNWSVYNSATDKLEKSGQMWIKHGTNSLTIDGLPAAAYRVVFDGLYKERNKNFPTYYISEPKNNLANYYTWTQASSTRGGTVSGFARHTYSGSESQSISSTVVMTIYNELEFPDVPGGGQQVVGGLSDLTMLGINGDILKLRPLEGPEYFLQSHIFIEKGIEVERLTWGGTGSSPFYGDLVYYLMQQSKLLQADQIDKAALRVANRVAERYDLYFNGVLQTTNSLAEWMTRTAPYFLMTPRQVDGAYGLWPVCPLNSSNELSRNKTVPVLTVTRDDIVEDSYTRNYISPKERRPVCLVMVYRDQPSGSVGQTVTVEVRYPGTALSGPFEAHDLTEFCCRAEQAVYAARYILSKRRYTTHTVSFTMARRAAQLKPGDVIKVDLAFDTTDGAGITDAIFYQIESLSEGQAGSVTIEATHFPTQRLDGVDDVSVVAYETHKGNVQIQ